MKDDIYKNSAIESLESIAHWMKTSTFDYAPQDLDRVLNEIKEDYKKYLSNKK
jgi:hypothetical protein